MTRPDPGGPPPATSPAPDSRPSAEPRPPNTDRSADRDAAPTTSPGAGDLFIGFLAIGISGFGGVLPIARRAIVERRRWLTPEQFAVDLGVAQLLPGPNIINLSVAIGMRFAGVAGALAAVVGLTALPLAVLLALLTVYAGSGHLPVVASALHGVGAVAAGLVAAMVWRIAAPLRRRTGDLAVAAATFAAIVVLRWPLLPVLAGGAAAGLLLALRRRRHG